MRREKRADEGAETDHTRGQHIGKGRRGTPPRSGNGDSFVRIAGEDVDIDTAAAAHQLVAYRAEDDIFPARVDGLADDELRDVAAARVVEDLLRRALAGE